MAIQPGEWEFLYQTSTATQLPWEIGGPDAALEHMVQKRQLPARADLLDAGCGLGSAAVYLAALGYRVTGIDLSPTAIEKAKRKAEQAGVTVTFVVGDAVKSPFKRGQFTVVYDRGCLQHLPKERQGHYARELLRLLRSQGTYIVEVAQDVMSVDQLTALLGPRFVLKDVQSLTHVERPTGIPRFHTVARFVKK
ncbi:MAG: class I SAM-dependent methyltransferase [Candidatus Kerfeldbacteria bacterium]|nr:class I SAM-dependent methyltransferase [Candidatus Kerfeldbacteria bacterium]